MRKQFLGRTGIQVSCLGFGTGTATPNGTCQQAELAGDHLADLLLYGYEKGINYWDTALAYETHGQVATALSQVEREGIILATKLHTAGYKNTRRSLEQSLHDLGTDYVDICFLHGVRTSQELLARQGALAALVQAKKDGLIRAVGLSSHGITALEGVAGGTEIDVLLARTNGHGLCMDASVLGIYDRLASYPLLKQFVSHLIPKRLIPLLSGHGDVQPISKPDFARVGRLLNTIHGQGKGIIGMKILAEGRLGGDVEQAMKYALKLPYIDSIVLGMTSRHEIDMNCQLIESITV